ncbi:ubiquinone biosynthesis accessory factor UbiJ [Acinetobacter rudis]|uniref:Ubiquinone biosynthesis protein UbiJ n=1 Tax=Acinetobacter rudis TaxID=632955 RepID=A0AAW8J6F1_9GAMM|nr:hypothetical protein [Acinetobacter rudis]MDQ8935284.1 hypothetical protein [Acinetobacter rudis]MDQ8952749.1 hypothetical protein [Acinetobacter rudis]MDQ9017521.1 hypothetical protein [Acinetobacter rudis]
MWSILALGAIERIIHHTINLDAIARIQVNQLQGQMLRVVIDSPQLSIDVFFDENKVRLEPTITGHAQHISIFEQRPFDQATPITQANATLHVDNVVSLLKLLLNTDVGTIPVQGDYHLLQKIQHIMQNAEPDLAAQLSPWVSPALAHEIGKLQAIPKLLQRSLSSKLFFAQDFIKEDSGLFAARWQLDDLQQQTRKLNQELDRFEAKVAQLKVKLNSKLQKIAAPTSPNQD